MLKTLGFYLYFFYFLEKTNNLAIIGPLEVKSQIVSKIIQTLELKIPQDKIEYIRTDIKLNPNIKLFNNFILIHFEKIDDEFQNFKSLLDVTKWVIITRGISINYLGVGAVIV